MVTVIQKKSNERRKERARLAARNWQGEWSVGRAVCQTKTGKFAYTFLVLNIGMHMLLLILLFVSVSVSVYAVGAQRGQERGE